MKGIVRCVVGIWLLTVSSIAISGEAVLTWIEPTTNEDETPLTDLAQYRIFYGCQQSGQYDDVVNVPAPANTYTVENLPDFGTCYFVATAVKTKGTQSVYSNEASQFMGSLDVPGPVADVQITWQESSLMAVSRGATVSNNTYAGGTDASVSHTVDSGTTLLIVSIGRRADQTISGDVTWNTTETMTLIDETTRSGSGGDNVVSTYGLVSPTATTATVSVTTGGAAGSKVSSAVNYIGTVTSSVAAATNFLEEDVNNSPSATLVFASNGTSGNALYVAAAGHGGDMDPAASSSSVYNELVDVASGADTNDDTAGWVGDLLNSAPAGTTITWNATDESAGHHLEIVAAGGAPAVSKLVVLNRNRGM
jgi:hypothetical protein